MKLSKVKEVPLQKVLPSFLEFMSTVLWKLKKSPDLYNQVVDKYTSNPDQN